MSRDPDLHHQIAAAVLRFAFDKKDKEFAPFFNVKDVSKWIQRAYESQEEGKQYIAARHYELKSFANLYRAMLDENKRRAEDLRNALAKRLARNSDPSYLPDIYIIDWPGADHPKKWDDLVAVWAHIASYFLLPKLFNARVTAVAWGRHLRAFIDSVAILQQTHCDSLGNDLAEMRAVPFPIRCDAKNKNDENPQRIYFPSLGDPLTSPEQRKEGDPWDSAKLRPSALVEDLAKAIGGFKILDPLPKPVLMPGVAGFIPMEKDGRGFNGNQAAIIKKFFQHSDGYVRVFGDHAKHVHREPDQAAESTPLINHVDTILLGVGSPKIENRFWIREFIEEGNVKEEDLKVTIGDVGGILMWKSNTRKGPTREQEEYLKVVASRITGLVEDDVRRCAQNERDRRADNCSDGFGARLGVCCLATQTARAESVLEAIERGLINTVVICDNLERGLLDLF